MFEDLRREISEQGETIQVEVRSDHCVPSIEIVKDKRILCLTNTTDNKKYPCLERAWTSWAEKVLVPPNEETRSNFGLVDETTGRYKRWSVNTVRKFLDMTPIDLANKVVKSWWERTQPADWHLIKYADNGVPGSVRYIGSERYRLYKHDQFLDDLSNVDLSTLDVRNSHLSEDLMCLRITDKQPLKIPSLRGNIFPGYNIINSENGSASILIKYLIYDLVCTNGLMIVYDSSTFVNQKHINFNVEEFRKKVSSISGDMDKLNAYSKKMITDLTSMKLTAQEIRAVMKLYHEKYNCSGSFAEKVLERFSAGSKGWSVLSAITELAQDYSWDSRMEHEENASRLFDDVMRGRHVKYLEKEANG